MAKYCGYHNNHNLLVAALILIPMIVNCECRLISRNQVEEKDDELINPLEMMSRDEIVQVAGYGHDKLSTVLITGTLICDTPCLTANHHQSLLPPRPISGVLVGATCHTNERDNLAKTETDKYGEFIIDLPSHLHSISNLDKVCSIKILQLPKDTHCHQSDFVEKDYKIELASVGNGIRTYTTGIMVIQQTVPKNSEACIMKEAKDVQEKTW